MLTTINIKPASVIAVQNEAISYYLLFTLSRRKGNYVKNLDLDQIWIFCCYSNTGVCMAYSNNRRAF